MTKAIVISSIVSGVALAICGAVIVTVEDTVGTLGLSGRDFWWLAFVLGFFVGLLLGIVEACIVTYFRIPIPWSIFLGLGSGLLAAGFVFLGDGSGWDSNHQRFAQTFLISRDPRPFPRCNVIPG